MLTEAFPVLHWQKVFHDKISDKNKKSEFALGYSFE